MDYVRLVMNLAIERYGSDKGVFNISNFQSAWRELSESKGDLDGDTVRLLLWGREDVVPLRGGAHYRLRTR